jgi:DNA-binding MarR family transcriptional regulator
MESSTPDTTATALDHRALAVALLDISSDVRRKSHEETRFPPLSNGLLEMLRVIEDHPGITVADLASRLGRQLSNVSAQLRELVALDLVTRTRDVADKRYVALNPTDKSLRIKTLLEAAWAGALAAATSRLSPLERSQIQASLPALQRLAAAIGDK